MNSPAEITLFSNEKSLYVSEVYSNQGLVVMLLIRTHFKFQMMIRTTLRYKENFAIDKRNSTSCTSNSDFRYILTIRFFFKLRKILVVRSKMPFKDPIGPTH